MSALPDNSDWVFHRQFLSTVFWSGRSVWVLPKNPNSTETNHWIGMAERAWPVQRKVAHDLGTRTAGGFLFLETEGGGRGVGVIAEPHHSFLCQRKNPLIQLISSPKQPRPSTQQLGPTRGSLALAYAYSEGWFAEFVCGRFWDDENCAGSDLSALPHCPSRVGQCRDGPRIFRLHHRL